MTRKKPKPPNTLSPDIVEKIGLLHTEQKSAATIANEVGCSIASVYNILARTGARVRTARELPLWERSKEAREELRRLCAEETPFAEIAERLGWSVQSVKTAIKRLGIVKPPARPRTRTVGPRPELTLAERETILAGHRADAPVSQIASQINRSAATVYNFLGREGLRKPAYRKVTLNQLSGEQTATLRSMSKARNTYQEIADALGLSNYQQAKSLLRQAGLHEARIHRLEDPTKKWCTVCKQEKDPKEFGYSRSGNRTKVTRCKRCRRDQELRKNYGITLSEYEDLLAQQRGVCAICERPPMEKVWNELKPLCVDHTHAPGIPQRRQRVRGLLCNDCNKALGHVRDNTAVLEKMIAYLRGFDARVATTGSAK